MGHAYTMGPYMDTANGTHVILHATALVADVLDGKEETKFSPVFVQPTLTLAANM